MKELLNFKKYKQKKLNNKGFEKPELIVIVAVLAILIVIGIIIGSIISGGKKDDNGIVMVSYNANGGKGNMENTECRNGSDCILKNNTFIKEGYEFIGWSTSESDTSVTYELNDTYLASSDITLYAIWKLKDITITYDANGGTGSMEKTTYTYGESKILLPENTYEKKGYTFSSWHIYSPTLDKWYGCTNNEEVCGDTKENNTLGWHDRNEITTYYDNKLDWNTTNSEYDMVYYAQWGENVYEIKYELNGGTNGKDAPISGVYGSTVTISNPTKKGFTFTGWTINGTDATLNEKELTIGTSDITLTANWATKITDYIQYLYNDSTLRKDNSLEKDNTSDTNIRYVGSNPNNYVKFNNELWRIIGVFNVSNGSTTSKRVKLVRNKSLLKASWDSSANNINDGKGISEWSQADIKIMLNDYYAGNSTSCTYCNGAGQSNCSYSCTKSVSKLSTTAKNMIENAVWYLGGIQYGDKDGDYITTTLEAYKNERNSKTIKNCKYPSDGNCTDNTNRYATWTGEIALIYSSDFGYASTNSSCYSDITYTENCSHSNWLASGEKFWTLTQRDSNYFANAAWYASSNFFGDNFISTPMEIIPSVYLKSNITIKSGNGTSSNPYELGI